MSLHEIPFTQFLQPDGRKASVSIERPQAVMDKAERIIAAGYRFECEMLTTGEVSFTISDDDGDHAIQVCNNDAAVLEAVDRLIDGFDVPGSGR